jgi:hypothetical protein
MRAYVYVDGFNLYYRALKGTAFKWLNLSLLATRVLDSADTVAKVRYFTARVSARSGDPDAPRRQQILFNALKTVPNLEFHYGRFLPKKKMRPLVSNGRFVEIHDTEEKGSDVNLATHLINDGWHKRYDTDLIELIRIVAKELRLSVGVVWLDGGRPNSQLAAAATFVRHISPADLSASQFPAPIILSDGAELHKPTGW